MSVPIGHGNLPYYQFLWDFPRVTGPSAMVNACAFARWTRRISRSPNGSFSTYWSPYHFGATSIRDHYDLGAERMKVVLIKHDPRGIFCYRGVYPRKRFRGADNSLLYYRAPYCRQYSHHRDSVFYLLSALGTDQQVSFLFFSRVPCDKHLRSTSFLSRSIGFARWDNVHDFTSVFYPSETFAEACRDLLQQNKVAAGCAYNVADPVFSVRSTATKPSTASHLRWVGLLESPFHIVENLDQCRH